MERGLATWKHKEVCVWMQLRGHALDAITHLPLYQETSSSLICKVCNTFQISV